MTKLKLTIHETGYSSLLALYSDCVPVAVDRVKSLRCEVVDPLPVPAYTELDFVAVHARQTVY